VEKDARYCLSSVNPTGRGAGAGPCCLIGGPKVLRALMASTSGQGASSGWRQDPRSGLNVYHYMGVPFYRASFDETGDCPLFAANLGPTGLCLVHAFGTAESLGLELKDQGIEVSSGARVFLLHGAFALLAWEVEAICGISNTPTFE
jgi:hypothetical protein